MAVQPRIINNQYQLLSPLGEGIGGMGVVYRATDLVLDRDVAIKMIRPELLDNADMEKRFRREAKALARLNHPNIANIYNFCRDGDEYCLIMEFVSGQNFAERLKNQGSLPQNEAIRLMVQALHGLGHAHDRGVLHRDLKPANLMLTADGTVKILDFGIAKLADAPATQTTLTNSLTGTVRYMAPELLDHGQPSPQSDLYALSLVLYELLTGRAAFRAPTIMRLMAQIVNEMPPPLRLHLPQAPEALEQLLAQMMAKQPERRLPDADAFASALLAVSAPVTGVHTPRRTLAPADQTLIEPVTRVLPAAPVQAVTAPIPDKKRSLQWLWLLGALLLLGGVGYLIRGYQKSIPAVPGLTSTGQPASEPAVSSADNATMAVNTPASKPTGAVAVNPKPIPSVGAPRPSNNSLGARPALTPVTRARQAQKTTPAPASAALQPLSTLPVSTTKADAPVNDRSVEPPADPIAAKPERPATSLTVTRQMTVRLVPVNVYRAGQLNRGDVVQFAVTALVGSEAVPLGQGVTARAVVSEVQASGELATRSYIFLKRAVLETGSETIKLTLTGSEPEIRFDARQTDAVIGPLLMRPARAFTVD